ncbi:MAG: mechanosensitive ion channel family protein [Nanoarchaeota archaeon]|nr:mechanosensitive ion channel family protein [Nanoarchaeota archaeon]MBU0962656.1 mechanosensitive ion channel family protein [Nanoarchaeota archaeon]
MDFTVIIKNEYLQALTIIIISLVFSFIINFIIKNYIKKLTEKTKTDLDDKIIEIISKPIYLIIISIGIYLSAKSISLLNTYSNIINALFFIVGVFIVTYIISKLFGVLIPFWFKVQKRFEKTPKLINKFINVIIYIIAILILLSHFNININPLIATLGIGGLAVGLALQNTLSNFFAGLHLISDKPIRVGDFIELQDGNISGYVEDIGWRSTRIKKLANAIIIIPNSKLAESIIINNSLPEQEIAALVQCGVSYKSDLKKVEKVTIDVARNIQKTVDGAVKNFEPFIRYNNFGDSNINFTIILRVEKIVNKYIVIHEFIKALKERYDKEKIEISWPVRKVYMEK